MTSLPRRQGAPAFLERVTLLQRLVMFSRAWFVLAAAPRRSCALIGRIALTIVALGAASIPAGATEAHRAMVVAENALAANAGVQILSRGGNAVDAAAATALATGVTNPASSGIGGGGFMLIYLARTHGCYALDFRE